MTRTNFSGSRSGHSQCFVVLNGRCCFRENPTGTSSFYVHWRFFLENPRRWMFYTRTISPDPLQSAEFLSSNTNSISSKAQLLWSLRCRPLRMRGLGPSWEVCLISREGLSENPVILLVIVKPREERLKEWCFKGSSCSPGDWLKIQPAEGILIFTHWEYSKITVPFLLHSGARVNALILIEFKAVCTTSRCHLHSYAPRSSHIAWWWQIILGDAPGGFPSICKQIAYFPWSWVVIMWLQEKMQAYNIVQE